MRADKLMELLAKVPPELEIVVGDPDCGLFWNPVVTERRAFTAWKVTEDWAERDIRHVNFFTDYLAAKRAADDSTLDVTGPVEVRAAFL